jgi:hypothetical protein
MVVLQGVNRGKSNKKLETQSTRSLSLCESFGEKLKWNFLCNKYLKHIGQDFKVDDL